MEKMPIIRSIRFISGHYVFYLMMLAGFLLMLEVLTNFDVQNLENVMIEIYEKLHHEKPPPEKRDQIKSQS